MVGESLERGGSQGVRKRKGEQEQQEDSKHRHNGEPGGADVETGETSHELGVNLGWSGTAPVQALAINWTISLIVAPQSYPVDGQVSMRTYARITYERSLQTF